MSLSRLTYPAAARVARTYIKHGRTIPDPYAWLEEPDADNTKAFVKAQADLFEQSINTFPHRQAVLDAITRAQDYPRTGAPGFYGGKVYFYHNTGMQNQPVLMRQATLEDSAPTVFFDPNTLSADGTSSVSTTAWSRSERFFAYAVSDKGSDWCHIRVRDATTGDDVSDRIEWVKYSGISWLRDEGFFYTRFPELKEGADKGAEVDSAINSAVYYHRLGTAQAQDVRVFDCPEQPKLLVGGEVSDCDTYAIFTTMDGCEPKNLISIARIPDDFGTSPRALTIQPIITKWEAEYNFLANNGTNFYFVTTLNAPLKRIIAIDVAAATEPDSYPTKEVVSTSDAKLDFCTVAQDTLLLVYLRDVKHVLLHRQLDQDASVASQAIDVPIGTVTALGGRRGSANVSFKMTSFLLPGRSWTFTVPARGSSGGALSAPRVFRDDTVQGFNPDDFETSQVFYESGPERTKVPMFIFNKKGAPRDGTNPTLLYGYGGFGISITPTFSASRLVFASRMNGVVAVANIRGGGEYGEAWHNAGRKATKQNGFLDFENAARYLHANKWSTPATTAIMGGSNGGLLVAACANRAPHLFGAVICQVGVLDMFKFHQFTIGHAWTSDYGNPDVEEDFEVLTQYSPLHNIKTNVAYPAVLCLTGDHDDRVVPLHTLKYIASMQHANPENPNPLLARVEISVGHGAGKPTAKVVAEAADIYSFVALTTGAKWN